MISISSKPLRKHIKDFLEYVRVDDYYTYLDENKTSGTIYLGNEGFGITVYFSEKLQEFSELILISFIITKLANEEEFMRYFFSKSSYKYYEITIDSEILKTGKILFNNNFEKTEILEIIYFLHPTFKQLAKNKGNIKKTYSELFSKQFKLINE